MPSYEQFDTDGKPVPPRDCCGPFLGRYDPREDLLEFLSLVSMTSLTIGIGCVVAGYLIPRDYTFDSNKPAAEMEAIEIYYATLKWRLDVCILVGMSFVVLGGLMLAGIILYLHVTADFWSQVCGDPLEDEDGYVRQHRALDGSEFGGKKLESQLKQALQNYGSTSARSSRSVSPTSPPSPVTKQPPSAKPQPPTSPPLDKEATQGASSVSASAPPEHLVESKH